MNNRADFLNGLKVGDEVCYSNIYHGIQIANVTRITPKRMFRLSNGTAVNKDGSIRGDKYFFIREVTDKDRKAVIRRQMFGYVKRNLEVSNLNDDDLKQIYEIVKKYK